MTQKTKTEIEKCLAGELYDCHAPEFLKGKARASEWCARYNAIPYGRRTERRRMIDELFGAVGSNVSVGHGFTCDFGSNIYIGSNVSINLNCTFIDCNRITIGNDVLIAPCVHLNTAAHPIELVERLTPDWSPGSSEYRFRTYALPIKIGNGCWIGANVVVLPGVTIGGGAVIGAGSVVTKDIPANVVAVGNPCRVVRDINR
jgi:acetyltransferase-like isoleucine patch superfamily enzyme